MPVCYCVVGGYWDKAIWLLWGNPVALAGCLGHCGYVGGGEIIGAVWVLFVA